MDLKKKLKQVKIIRKIIQLNCLNNKQLNEFCDWLGFDDTGFRDASPVEKLQDYLLQASYWKRERKTYAKVWKQLEEYKKQNKKYGTPE